MSQFKNNYSYFKKEILYPLFIMCIICEYDSYYISSHKLSIEKCRISSPLSSLKSDTGNLKNDTKHKKVD